MSSSLLLVPPRRLWLLALCLALATVAVWWWSPGCAAFASASEGSAMHGLATAADGQLAEPSPAVQRRVSAAARP